MSGGLLYVPTTQPVDFTKTIDLSLLKDATALITGGAAGIGLAVATRLAEHGAFVSICDFDAEAGEAAVKSLQDRSLKAAFNAVDVTSYASQLAAFKSTIAASPNHTIDIVLASAGITGLHDSRTAYANVAPFSVTSPGPPEPPAATFTTNLTAVYYTTHLAQYYFQATRRAPSPLRTKHLLYVSSLAGYLAIPTAWDYTAAKHGVRGLWKAVRHSGARYAEQNGDAAGPGAHVRANLLAPSFVRTRMTAGMEEHLAKQQLGMSEVGDVAAAVVRLCCDESVEGRAVAIAASVGEPGDGSGNFDLLDDAKGGDGGVELLRRVRDGALGPGFVDSLVTWDS